jgi:hypothetical protein
MSDGRPASVSWEASTRQRRVRLVRFRQIGQGDARASVCPVVCMPGFAKRVPQAGGAASVLWPSTLETAPNDPAPALHPAPDVDNCDLPLRVSLPRSLGQGARRVLRVVAASAEEDNVRVSAGGGGDVVERDGEKVGKGDICRPGERWASGSALMCSRLRLKGDLLRLPGIEMIENCSAVRTSMRSGSASALASRDARSCERIDGTG